MDINSILQSVIGNANQQIANVEETKAGFDQDTARISERVGQNQVEGKQLIGNAQGVAQDTAELNFRLDKAREFNTRIAGMDPDDLNNQFVQSVAALDAAQAARVQARAAFDAAASVSIMDNPIGYLVNQMKLPQLSAINNAAVAEMDAASSNITTRVALIKAKESIIPANTASQQRDIALRTAQVKAQEATINLRAAEADNIGKISNRALQSAQLGSEAYRITADVHGKLMSAEQLRLQRESVEINRAQARAATLEKMEQKQLKADEEAQINKQLAVASAALGYEVPVTMTSLKLMTGPKKDMLLKVVTEGALGNGFGDAMTTINTIGNLNGIVKNNPGLNTFLQRANTAVRMEADKVIADANNPTKPKRTLKPGQATAEGLDNYEAEVIMSNNFSSPNLINSREWDGKFNPYKPEHFGVLDFVKAGRAPQLSGNRTVTLVEAVKASSPAGAPNLTGQQMSQVFQAMATNVANGSITLDVAAADMAKFYNFSAAFNADLFQYEALGLPKQTSTLVKVPGIGTFSDTVKVDLQNPASLKKHLAQVARQSSLMNNLQGMPSMGVANAVGSTLSTLTEIRGKVTDTITGKQK